MQNLQIELVNLLKHEDNLVIDGHLNKNKIAELALKVEPQLISLLIKNDTFKKHFFQEVENVLVFDKIKFQRFVNNKSFLPDSYTAFKNKIGLITNDDDLDNFISSSNNVVLAWPHKDCILEGGQTKEEQKRNEIFWNETLAPDSVDRLLDAKVLTNFKKFDRDGELKVTEIKGNENLIIKGNNLLALASLLKTHRGRIKLIYIDPPYNTGSDSFGYNDNFNQSTWLTFMKNRLEIAKKLLDKSGILMVQCSFHQYAYLKILMNETFEKHLCDFNIQVRHPDRALTGDKEYNDVIEYTLIYSNDISKKMPFLEEVKTVDDYKLEVVIKEGAVPLEMQFDNKLVEIYSPDDYKVVVVDSNKNALKKISIRGSIREKNSSGRFFVKHLEGLTEFPSETLFKVPDMGDDAVSYRYFYSAPTGKKNGGYFQGMPTSSNVTRKQYSNFYNFEKEYNNVSKQGGVEFRNGKKPEELLKFYIELFSNENDFVLDYHLGSGTTAVVAHKMKRRYIGIEQMDYIETLAIERLKNVINAEQSGISKEINWQGGGSFIFTELMQYNQKYIDLIQNAETKEQLINVWNEMEDKAFLSYQFDKKTFNERLEAFKTAPIGDMKQYLMELLDKNQLYVNYSEIKDKMFEVSELDKELNKQFYSK